MRDEARPAQHGSSGNVRNRAYLAVTQSEEYTVIDVPLECDHNWLCT